MLYQFGVCRREEEKLAALLVLVREVIPAGRPTLIFASTRHHVDLLALLLDAEGISATFVYGTLDQARPSGTGALQAHAAILYYVAGV